MNANDTQSARSRNRRLALPALLAAALLLGACSKAPVSLTQAPVEVSVSTLATERVPVTSELNGRITSPRVAQVRARVTGVVLHQLYQEGSDVKEGDLLFQIDPEPLQAAYDSAKATLAKAEASLADLQATADRYAELVKIDAVSRQTYDEAVSSLATQKAEILVERAALRTAELNLSYTKVTAPISGRIGKALVTEGALVSASELTQLAVIRQLDQVYVDFTQPAAELLKLRRALAAGSLSGLAADQVGVSLVLEDGTTYEHAGSLRFSDVSVDETTGMVTLRAAFPNPENLLLPGTFVRVHFTQAVDNQALTAPQRAVARNADGSATVLVVSKDNHVESRRITTGDAVGDRWVVTSGLKAGERIIIEGLQKVRNGDTVSPLPFGKAAKPGSASAASSSETAPGATPQASTAAETPASANTNQEG